MDISLIFNLGYWFNPSPGPEFKFFSYFFVFYIFIFIIALFIFFYVKIKKNINPILKKILKKLPIPLEIFSLCGIFIIIFRISNAYFLSMRIFLFLWFIAFFTYIYFIILKFKTYPEKLEKYIEKEQQIDYTKIKPKIKKRKKKFKNK